MSQSQSMVNSSKMFVTNNRSMEYNIDETYIKLNDGLAPVNRRILNIKVEKSQFQVIYNKLFENDLELIKKNEVHSFEEETKQLGVVFRQCIGYLKIDKTVVVDIAQDYYDTLQIFILYGDDETTIVPLVDKITEILKTSFKEEVRQNFLHIITDSGNGLNLSKITVKEVKDKDNFIENNYNEDFDKFNETLIQSLRDNHSGLILLHGLPGTGKTNYIRYLISQDLNERKIIYVPPDMTHSISSPAFISFMMENKDSILIIEDAENILRTREAGGTQAIANLLNLSDGLLGDCLASTIICTFNASENDLDTALLRKGRLVGKYKFTELSLDKTIKLLNKLGIDIDDTIKPMTLADIYKYQDSDEFGFKKEVKRSVGFY